MFRNFYNYLTKNTQSLKIETKKNDSGSGSDNEYVQISPTSVSPKNTSGSTGSVIITITPSPKKSTENLNESPNVTTEEKASTPRNFPNNVCLFIQPEAAKFNQAANDTSQTTDDDLTSQQKMALFTKIKELRKQLRPFEVEISNLRKQLELGYKILEASHVPIPKLSECILLDDQHAKNLSLIATQRNRLQAYQAKLPQEITLLGFCLLMTTLGYIGNRGPEIGTSSVVATIMAIIAVTYSKNAVSIYKDNLDILEENLILLRETNSNKSRTNMHMSMLNDEVRLLNGEVLGSDSEQRRNTF